MRDIENMRPFRSRRTSGGTTVCDTTSMRSRVVHGTRGCSVKLNAVNGTRSSSTRIKKTMGEHIHQRQVVSMVLCSRPIKQEDPSSISDQLLQRMHYLHVRRIPNLSRSLWRYHLAILRSPRSCQRLALHSNLSMRSLHYTTSILP